MGIQYHARSLEHLTAEAAVELDNCRLRTSDSLAAVALLHDLLVENREQGEETTKKLLITPSVATVFQVAFRNAVDDRDWAKMHVLYDGLTRQLGEVRADSAEPFLVDLRDKCLALAQASQPADRRFTFKPPPNG